jgi:hypothetical protein
VISDAWLSELTSIPGITAIPVEGYKLRIRPVTTAECGTTAVAEIASSVSIDGNYPNPFSKTTSIRFNSSSTKNMELKVFNMVGKEMIVDLYENISCPYFDAISTTEHKDLWHRGFPIEYLQVKNNIEYKGQTRITPLVQAEFWDGDPDIDAICRLSKKPIVKFNKFEPFTTNQLTPFNSQNTFLHRSVLKNYSVFPFTGRMDDIWGAYVMQHHHPNSVVFTQASVYQARNPQDLVKNLENEVIGYRNTLKLLEDLPNYKNILPEQSVVYFEIYQKYFDK